jgi:PAS domain S-box-containing protein
LSDSEQYQYHELVDSGLAVFWRKAPNFGAVEFVSRGACNLLGFTEREWTDTPTLWEECIHPEDRPLYVDVCCRAAAGQVQRVDHRMRDARGNLVWVRSSVSVSAQGAALLGMTEDLSDLRRAEHDLDWERRLFSVLMEWVPDHVYFKDLQSRFLRISHAQASLFQLADPREARGKTDADFFSEAHAQQALRDEQNIIRTGIPIVGSEEEETWPGQSSTWVTTTKMPLRNENGEICGTFGVSRDITQRKRAEIELRERSEQLSRANQELQSEILQRRLMEQQLVQAQKLESIGQLAAGVAHEINTPIQYVGDNCQFVEQSFREIADLLREYRNLARVEEALKRRELAAAIENHEREADLDFLLSEVPVALKQCNEGIGRVTNIVKAMKEFSHPNSDKMESINLNRAIENTLTVCRSEWKYVAEISADLDPDLPLVRCLPGEVNQVILNLVVNAAHAIADANAKRQGGGKISISTGRRGNCAEIRIGDNGTGIPEEAQPRIFDPFFTTKPVGKGTGQGLALARNVVVNKHHGSLTFETTANVGSTFIVRLPFEGVAPDPASLVVNDMEAVHSI